MTASTTEPTPETVSTDPLLVIMCPGFEEMEFTAPVDILRRLGISVTTAGLQSRNVEGAHGITMRADMLLVDVDTACFSGVILPGGPASWTLRDTPAVLKIVREMNAAGKPVAAICAAPLALEAAGVIKGRRVTCYPSVQADLTSATVCQEPTCTDGNIITGKGPCAAAEFGFALGCYLGKTEEVARLRREMCQG